jgi:hypothetical protein
VGAREVRQPRHQYSIRRVSFEARYQNSIAISRHSLNSLFVR